MSAGESIRAKGLLTVESGRGLLKGAKRMMGANMFWGAIRSDALDDHHTKLEGSKFSSGLVYGMRGENHEVPESCGIGCLPTSMEWLASINNNSADLRARPFWHE